jgi:hypothetical protein
MTAAPMGFVDSGEFGHHGINLLKSVLELQSEPWYSFLEIGKKNREAVRLISRGLARTRLPSVSVSHDRQP